MCIIAFSWQPDQDVKLRLLSNRDEFYHRPTLFAHFWMDHMGVFGGRDEEKGGSWLLSSTNGKIAAVTNFREPITGQQLASRGAIPLDFVNSEDDPTAFAEKLSKSDAEYPGYNALFCDGKSLVYASNRLLQGYKKLEPGIYCVSNGLLDSDWPKVIKLKERFSALLAASDSEHSGVEPDQALDLLTDTAKAPPDKLPSTGIREEQELLLSPIFIEIGGYGTRNSSYIEYREDRIEISERQYIPVEQECKQTLWIDHNK